VDTQFKRIDGVRGILAVNVSVDKSISVDNVNKYEAILSITHGKTTISVPMVLYINPLAINAISNGNGILTLSLTNGNSNMIDSNGKNGNVSSNGLDDNAIGKWKYASIKIIDPLSMRSRVVTLTPDNNHVKIPLNSGEYWIEATVTTSNNNRMSIFSTVYISNSTTINEQQQLPFKELLIVIGAISIAMVTVLIIGKKREERYMKEIIRNERLNITSSDEKASSMGLGIDDKDKITNSDEDNKTTDS
jgi:hypothetical protein